MDRHTVGTEVAKMAMAIITRDGWASAKTLAAAIPCDRRTAGRIIALFKSEGLVVKSGYGVEPIDSAAKIRPHSDTDEHSATGSSMTPEMSITFGHNIRTSRDSATTSGHIRPSQLLKYSNTVTMQSKDGLGMEGEPDGLGMEGEPTAATNRADSLSRMEEDTSGRPTDIEEPAAPPLALRAADDEQQQPWGPTENEQASLDYQEWLTRKHQTTEITGVGGADAEHHGSCDVLIGQDRDMAAYHVDLDKLIAFASGEREARKLKNRQLGKARGQCRITRSQLHNGMKEHSELLRVIVGLTEDLESGELRYYNLQAAGETLDMCWPEWRQKMAMDPGLIQHYRDMAAQLAREARKEAWEDKRHAAQDLQDEIAATKIQEPAAILAIEPDDSDPEWNAIRKETYDRQAAALARPSVYKTEDDFAKADAEGERYVEQQRQADADARYDAAMAELNHDMAQDAAASQPPAPEPATEPVGPSFGEAMARLDQEIARLLAAAQEPATPAPAAEVAPEPSVIPAAVQEPAAVGDDTLTDEELWRQRLEEEQAGDPAACGTYGHAPMATEPAVIPAAIEPVAVQELSAVVEVPAAPAPAVEPATEPPSLKERIIWNIQRHPGEYDLMAVVKVCRWDYESVARKMDGLNQQGIIRRVNGKWWLVADIQRVA